MAPPVWTLMLLVGVAWGQDQVPNSVWRLNSPNPKPMMRTLREDSILSKCDFEDNSRPFCDWSQMSEDDGDWVRTTGPSLTGTSGPPGGYPNGEGYYLHMDPKTFPPGGVARLRSPDIWEQGPLCIHFAFHMFGLSWGAQLRLLLLRGRKHRRPYMLWKHANTQSPSWMPTTVTVPANHDIPSWLMFEGKRGNTAYLDISLDGLSIQRGTCNRICMSQMCTFDTLDDLCGWSWIPTATGAKWTQKWGSSGKLGVGPDEDFSNPGNGYYMLLDPTNARPGQKAVLLSPLSHSSGCLTLSFYYIMHGQGHEEGLFVYATFLGNIRKHTLFSGHPGPDWQAVSVNYTGQGQIQFIVVGIFGSNPEPAIAVDAISIAPCGERFPQCDFEDRAHPFCEWKQVFGDIGHWSWGSKSVPTPISGSPREFPYGGEHYIFFDSVKLSHEGQSARLVSPPFCAPGDICVEFAYHMYGLGKGTTLKLLLGSPAGSSPIPLWSRVGSQSSGWINSSVTISKGHQQPMQLVIKATRGTSTAFAVALNFIFITHGPCRELLQTEIPSSLLLPPTGPSEPIAPMLPMEPHDTYIDTIAVPTELSTTSTEEITIPTEVLPISTEVTAVHTKLTNVSPEETSVPPEETILTDVTTVSLEEATLPTEVTTVLTEVTTVLTEVTTLPTEVLTVSTEVTAVHTKLTNVSPEETSVPPEETILTDVTTVSPEEATLPTEVTTVLTEVTTVLTKVLTVPTGETTVPTEVPIVSAEVTGVHIELTNFSSEETSVLLEETIPIEISTVSPEETVLPTEATTLPTDVPTVLTEVTTVSTEVINVSPEETSILLEETIPIQISTVSPEETVLPTEATTLPTDVPTVPTEEIGVHIEVTKVSLPEETTTPAEVTTVSPAIISPEETTVPSEETTVPPEETTIPSEETPVSTQEITLLTEQSTVSQTFTACTPPCPSTPLMTTGPSLSNLPSVSMIGMVPTTGSCPPNAHLELCACLASCENPKPSCQSPCTPDCVCNPGFLFSNNQCINESSCNCPYNNKYYKPGEEWFSPNCTEHCRCLPGSTMECRISQCGTHTVCQEKSGQYLCEPYGRATCLVYGDLHFVTFDERHIGFTGTCTYILTQTCDNSTDPFFRITGSIRERGVEGVSCLDKVFITLPETTITMIRGRHTLIGDQEVTLPAIPSNDIYVGLSGRFVELKTTFGLRVRWDGDQQLFVTVSSTYSGKLCGFCGNYDGDGSNDNLKSDGMVADDEEDLGQSWQVENEEEKECQKKMTPPSCDAALRSTMLGPTLCGQLVNPNGPFEACLVHLKASSFLDNCVSDMCSFQGLQQKLCAHMSVIMAACQDAGYPVKPWREPEFCPLVCPENSRYSLCAKPCPDTCHPGSATQFCSDNCVEACECDPGFILSGSKCVPSSQCGCTSLQGRYFKIQEQWFNPDCKEICTCESHNNIQCKPWNCKAQEACSYKNGILGCYAQGAATCIASGDPHYQTFDGALHHFMGTCTYVLTQPCWPNSQDNNFVVSATNEIRSGIMEVSYVKAVHVQVFDLKISLLEGRKVVLNNQRVVPPLWPSKGRVTIRLSGIFVLLHTNFGLQVRYDGRHLVEVTVPSSYTGTLCGLCGNYNNNSLDDNLRADMKPAVSSLLLGASWKILEASDPGCFQVEGKHSSCLENDMDDTWIRKCAILMNPVGPFSSCHEVVPPQASFSSCVYGQCGTNGDNLTLCRSLQAYASLCGQAGQVITWRNSTFCPLRCPPRSNYNPCANSCPATCLTLSTPRDCPILPCVEGCECQRGHILSGTTCVPLRQCGCSDQDGFYHLLGESWYTEKTCTTLCTCSVHSNITCSPTSCEANHVCLRQDGLLRCAAEVGECHISEDSQIVSFDDHNHLIQDTCTYILVKVCHPNMNLPFFTISAKMDVNTNSQNKAFHVYQLYIDIFNFHITLQKDHSVLISLINDSVVTLPATTQIPGVSIVTEDAYTIVTIKDEIQVKFESNSFLNVKIPASTNGKVCGVCGNFNGEEDDELMTPSDELAEDEQEFMNSWKDENIDSNCQKIGEHNIQVDQQEVMNGKCWPMDFENAQESCQTALQGPAWAQCSSQIPIKPFLLKCMNIFCEFRELFRALCESLQSFEDACQNQGLKPSIWRNSSFCPLECPAHSHYTNCLPSCPPSCLDPDSRCEGSGHKVPSICKEGCICQPDYVLNNDDKCVLKTHCGCKDAQGVFIPEGKNWISSSCTQTCVCIGGAIECQNFQCPSGAQCQDNGDGSSNCVKITVQCPAHSMFVNCVPPCPPTCSNPDGHCEGTSPSVPSTCKEGCLCHPGFVLDMDKCVPRIQCACKDTRNAFILAGKTWISEDCTQSCTCTEDNMSCQNFQCPPGTHCKDNGDGSSNCVKISLQCPAHSQFTDCLPPCQPSCSDPDGHCEGINTKGLSNCKEGCVCQPGYVLHDNKCVLRIECGCQDTQGGFIPAGKTWTSRGCSQSCNCMEGVIQCQNFQCPSGTYCQDIEDGTSNCANITLQCPAHSSFTSCLPSCLPSCLDPEGHCEGSTTKDPFTCKEGCVCQPDFVLLNNQCVPRTECGCKDAQGVLIPADKRWINQGCTQICTCVTGTIHCRDFKCPSGTYCKEMEDDTSSCVELTVQCPAHSLYTHCLPSCLPSCSDPDGLCGGTSLEAPSTCREGCACEPGYVLNKDQCVPRTECGCKDAQGVLIPAGKTWINRGCTQTCTCMGGAIQCRQFQCPSETYCKDIEDGNSNCTNIPLQCPPHSHYANCSPPCQPSCSDPEGHCEGSSTKAPSTCKDGCVCEPGYVLNDDKCVPRIECDCKDIQGVLIPAGKTWINRGCTQSCTCKGGTIQCQTHHCPSGTYCEDTEDANSSCATITLQCPAHSNFTSCLPSCLPSCLDPEGHCEGSTTKDPFTCKEGCVCQPDYVLLNDQCVPRTECGCKDTQGVLIPADKTWINRGCTQTCTCMGGAIQCRQFQCPSETYCKDIEDGNSNCTNIPLQCPANSNFTSCLPSCLPSCLDPEGHCEGSTTKDPFTCKEGCICQPDYVLLNDQCVPRTECGCKDTQGALNPADKTWISKDCTQTCTCSAGAIHCRNFQCPSGTYCKNSDDGSRNCTTITVPCPANSQFTDCLPSCLPSCSNRCEVTSPNIPSSCREGCLCNPGFVFSEDKCVPITLCSCQDAQDAIIPAGKTWTSKGCTQSCTCMGGDIQCQNFQCPPETYCKDNSEGSSACTKITLQCPAHSQFTSCLPSCLPSCLDPYGLCKDISAEVPPTCKEGCICESGYVLDSDKCVLRVECGCKDTEGALIPAGKTWTSPGCTQSCTCVGGDIQCQNSQCPPGTHCKDSGDGSSSCVKMTLQCPVHSNYTDCLPSCLPSCLDPSDLCGETSPKVPSTCKEGCVCLPGYVLDSDKCVLRIECSCRDGQGAVIPAGKTWISKGCAQSCTCTGGIVHCQDFQCPPGTHCKDSSDGSSDCTDLHKGAPGEEKDGVLVAGRTGALQCPAHSHFTVCLPSCPPSCSNLDGSCVESNFKAPSVCKEGCVCQPGYLLNNNKCVLRIQCGCKDTHGGLIPAGRTWISPGCTQSCNCMGGNIQCRNFQCPPGTYCKDSNDSTSNCAKITLQCPAHSHYTNCLPACLPSCTDPDGHCEVTSPKVPSPCKEGCLCQHGYVMHNHKCVLQIHCDCKDAQGGFILAGTTWISSDCTQSCTCMGGLVQCHNFTCPPGTQCLHSNCSRITAQCPPHSHYTDCLPPCPPSCFDPEGLCGGTSPRAPSTCREGCVCEPGYVLSKDKCVPRTECGCKDAQGALIPANKTWLTRDCTQNCTCKGGDIHCSNSKCPLGSECKDSIDGSSSCAKIALQCPAHSQHTNCLPSCIPSCSNINGRCEVTSLKSPSTCIEGCLCQSGFVFDKDKCIPRIQCSCKDSQGTLIPAGKNWIAMGCSQRCICTGGLVQCYDFECPSGTKCQDVEDGNSNCVEITVQCPTHSHYSKCLPSCLPSCSDPEGLCGGTSPRASSTCKEGCVCQAGYVWNNSKCIPSSECACKDAHGVLIPEGETWLSRGCTKSCTCEGGTIQCHDFRCPTGSYCKDNKDGGSNCVTYALKCSAHSIYTDCLPSCSPSCSDPEGLCGGTSPEIPSTCREGCVCEPGYLLNKDTCVHKDQCDCKDIKGDVIPAGRTWISSGCTQSCACTDGVIQCQDFVCPSGSHCQHNEDGSSDCAANKLEKCTIFGDPYYHTFDGFTYHFLGRMNYYLIKTEDKLPKGIEPLITEGRNKVSPKGSPTLHEVTITVYGCKIQLQEGLVVLVNSQKVAVPYNQNEHLRVFLRAQRLLLVTDFEMVVDFDGKHSAVISLPTTYRGLIRGLCGNYDKNQANDFMLPSGVVTSDVHVFGSSWEVKVMHAFFRFPRALPEEEGRDEEPDLLQSECSPEQTALSSSTQACGVLVDPQGPFAACHQIIAPEPFEQRCVSDMCTGWKSKEEEELRCRVLSGYAIICQEAGANMTGWRDQTHCAMTCPANTVYQSCMTPCPASCAKFVTPKVCEGPCVEGCASLPGYIYSDTQSLPVTHCGCTTDGIYYKLGHSFVTDDCSQHCTCASRGVLLCEPYGCRAGESCTVANFTRGCFQDSPCLQNPCQNDGRCEEQGASFICHCDFGYGGKFCTEPRDVTTRKKLAFSLAAILPGVLVMLLVPVLLPRVYVYMTTRTAVARRRRGEKLLRTLRLEDTDVPEPTFKATEF